MNLLFVLIIIIIDGSIYHVTYSDSPVFLLGSSPASTSGDTQCDTLQDPHALLLDSSTPVRSGYDASSSDSSTRHVIFTNYGTCPPSGETIKEVQE